MRQIFVLAALAFLVGCATPETQYVTTTGGRKLSSAEAQIAVLERRLANQAASKFDAPVRLAEVSLPEYPDVLRRAGIEGIVRIQFTVERDGTVVNPVVVGSAPPALVDLSLAAIRAWRFEPLRRNGEIVRQKFEQQFRFQLE